MACIEVVLLFGSFIYQTHNQIISTSEVLQRSIIKLVDISYVVAKLSHGQVG